MSGGLTMGINNQRFHFSTTIVVPVYNSEKSLPVLVDTLECVLPQVAPDFELILVDDGSHDNSWQVVNELAGTRPWIQGIKLTKNFGQHNALLFGIRAAAKEVILTMDDDLQNPPEEIPLLLAKLAEGYDVVYGTPKQERHTLWRSLASQATKIALQNDMGEETARRVSAFRAMRSHVADSFASYHGPHVNIDVLLTWGTSSFTSLEVQQHPRKYGKSNYTFQKLLAHSINMITGFTTLPLRFASLVGFGCTFFGMVVLAYVVGRYLLYGAVVQGFAFLASIIAIFSGAQLFALGIIGEYLARIYLRIMGQPAYQVLIRTGHPPRAK